jgi:hypothetical protein
MKQILVSKKLDFKCDIETFLQDVNVNDMKKDTLLHVAISILIDSKSEEEFLDGVINYVANTKPLIHSYFE